MKKASKRKAKRIVSAAICIIIVAAMLLSLVASFL